MTTYKSWKHHIYRNGAPLCGSKARYPVAATSASLVVQLCGHCARLAGPAAPELVRCIDHDPDALAHLSSWYAGRAS